MNVLFDYSHRQVVPRWLDYHTSSLLGLLSGAQPRRSSPVAGSFSFEKQIDWKETPNLLTAADLVAESLILATYADIPSQNAAHFILKQAPSTSLLIRELAAAFIQKADSSSPSFTLRDISDHGRNCVATLKRLVRAGPRNPIAWSDLALCYAMQGHQNKASRAMTVALSLGPQNRFILRNAARCFLHLGDTERAVNLLRTSGLCENDPWIASAEIAVSEGMGIRSVSLKRAKVILGDENNSPFSRSELAMALSTVEAKGGAHRKTKHLIQQALIAPSENALAQIEWLASMRHTQAPPQTDLIASFEAQARHLFRAKLFSQCLEETEKWSHFQPFSCRPLVLATFLASVCLDDDSRTIRIFTEAAPASKHDPLLLNNIAFAYARQDNVTAAINSLRQVEINDLPERTALTVTATRGIISFRLGHLEEGRAFYRKAVAGLERLSYARLAAMAVYNWACEESRLATADAPARITDAKKRIKQEGVFELEQFAEKL